MSELPIAGGQADLPVGVPHILVELSGRSVALPLAAMVEFVDLPELAAVPLAPDWLSGVANLRGVIIPVIDLSRLLDWPAANPSRRALVLRDGRFRLAVPVETVREVHWLEQEQTTTTTPIRGEMEIDGRPTWVLNPEAILARVRRGDQAVLAGR